MFIKEQVTVFSLTVFSLAGFLYYSLALGKLKTDPVATSKPLQNSIFEQKRSDVTKDFYVCDNNNRYHHSLSTPTSTLHYDSSNKANPLTETMENISGTFQDKMRNNGFQQIHSLWAPSGTYHYATRFFTCSRALVSLFSIPGEKFPERLDLFSPFLEGSADNISFVFDSADAILKSDHFKAKINTDNREKV